MVCSIRYLGAGVPEDNLARVSAADNQVGMEVGELDRSHLRLCVWAQVGAQSASSIHAQKLPQASSVG